MGNSFFDWIDKVDKITGDIENAVDNPKETTPLKPGNKADIEIHENTDEAAIIAKVCVFIENNSKLHPSMIIAGIKQGLWKGE